MSGTTHGTGLDLYDPRSTRPTAVVLLLHGRGPNERDVMAPLATELSLLGAAVVVPDWDPEAEELPERLGVAARATATCAAELECTRLIVAGWSTGGSAAHWLGSTQTASFTGLALIGASLEPLPTLPPVAPRPIPAVVVTGSADRVVTSDASRRAADALRALGHPVQSLTVEADHAGLIQTEYDAEAHRCRPSSSPSVLEAGRTTARSILAV